MTDVKDCDSKTYGRKMAEWREDYVAGCDNYIVLVFCRFLMIRRRIYLFTIFHYLDAQHEHRARSIYELSGAGDQARIELSGYRSAY